MAVVAAAVAAAVVGGVALASRRGQQAPAAVPAKGTENLPEAERGAAGAGVPATAPVPPAAVDNPLAQEAAKKAATSALGSVAGTVVAGFKAAELQRQVVTAVAGEGLGNTAAVFGPTASVAALAKTGAETLAAKVGVPAPLAKAVGQTVGLAVAGGPVFGVPLVGAKVTAELASAGIRAVAGPQAERQVRDVFKGLDPTNSKNITHAPIAAAAAGVKAVTGFFGGLFGKKK
jgi:hypothetical protein